MPQTLPLYRFFSLNGGTINPVLPNEILIHINEFSENIYYTKAKELMQQIVLPTNEQELAVYSQTLHTIVDDYRQKALHFYENPPAASTHSPS
ncbi:hypothetical protein [Legionella hackeliae]|uniref:Uncharacterized protein n=1 Tax=Legionella hackeliae TaxID=449 RepID=A0A0A8UYH3_LEGHA|nr:hypothetical protein [Legionella hackeliae]KTD09882.1 hypothetical protein Lhac_2250 [Legionella hackeliae]CEK11819.1 protein of unknown function [Legionella hackeliae]STX48587.1 Uncharacterised protein [Legionella hackeliae]